MFLPLRTFSVQKKQQRQFFVPPRTFTVQKQAFFNVFTPRNFTVQRKVFFQRFYSPLYFQGETKKAVFRMLSPCTL